MKCRALEKASQETEFQKDNIMHLIKALHFHWNYQDPKTHVLVIIEFQGRVEFYKMKKGKMLSQGTRHLLQFVRSNFL